MQLWQRFFQRRFWVLAIKEIAQIRRNRQLIFLLTISPILQLLIFGFALSPDVNHLKLGIVDEARVPASRELIAALTENRVLVVDRYSSDQQALSQAVRDGDIEVGSVDRKFRS
jgi:ABC-2 type transport system permease protein